MNKDKAKERGFTRSIRNVCIRQGFPFRRRLGLERAVKYGVESSLTIDEVIKMIHS
jgi:hypothetical protein